MNLYHSFFYRNLYAFLQYLEVQHQQKHLIFIYLVLNFLINQKNLKEEFFHIKIKIFYVSLFHILINYLMILIFYQINL